jgi:DNA-binding MarR family transcriptional regulator
MPPTTLSHYLRDMRRRGHVEEVPNPRDGRSQLMTLTADGLATHRGANRHFENAYRRFFARIADEAAVKGALADVENAAREAAMEARAALR